MNKEYIELVSKYILNAAILLVLVMIIAACLACAVLLDEGSTRTGCLFSALILGIYATYLAIRQCILLNRIEKIETRITEDHEKDGKA